MPQMCQSRPEKRNADNELGTDVCTFSQKGASKKISIVWVMFGVFINDVLERAETSPKDCIMSPYTEGRLDRYHIGIPRENPKSALDLGLSEGSLTCDPYSHITWRANHIYYVASQPRTSDRLISHWRALCLLAHDNRRCSIQPEIFTHQNFAQAGIRSRFDNGRVQCAYC